ncbi:MAG: L,D-transpeptidase [Kofleriaceae bacterium]
MALGLCACGSKKVAPEPEAEDPAAATDPIDPDPDDPDEAPPPLSEFPDSTRSLELVRTVSVRLAPAESAKRIGSIAIDTRIDWSKTAKGDGCKKSWIQMRPRGWICGDYVKPSTKPAFGREVPMLDRGELVPGVYGKVTAASSVTYTFEKPKPEPKGKPKPRLPKPTGPVTSPDQVEPVAPTTPIATGPRLVEGRPLVGSVNVRQYEELVVDDKTYWKISKQDPEYVLSKAIRQHQPSVFAGARLADDTGWALPVAFVWPRVAGWRQAYTTHKEVGGGINRTLAARTAIPILETAAKAGKPTAYRIGAQEWIAAADVRVFQPTRPPKLLAPNERWIDVDLDSQIMVAFEGELAVYATMVSTGGKETPTETGEYRMWLKESEADMKGLNGEDPYSVATVPWTQFFSPEKGLALHTAYWHDQFGTRRSHGCVNLAPRDARWLYFWSDPQVPPGWTMAAGVVEAPGSIVRVRSKEDPEPEPKGYAKKVVEARQQNAPR